ncbi:MAG: zinc ABC transporter substrate-binding protein, partial [Anaerolineales bacterium]|nr:zinc ABC transporter substrate-binding protein [Anaerolineales bacterium]
HHHHGGQDPHVWMDPHNVQAWSAVISTALSQADPAHAAEYQANAARYQAQLEELNGWIAQQVAAIPVEQRQLVTDHESFNYFARRYQFEIVGVLIPSFSSLSEVSAGELATLEQSLSSHAVPAIFIASSINPSLAERIADDIGVQLVTLYAESLSEAQGPAPSYLEMMRYNASAIVDALK